MHRAQPGLARCPMKSVLIRNALILVSMIFWPAYVLAQEPTPDPRFGLVQTYDDFEAAAHLGPGFTRIKLYWDIIQPDGPTDWRPANVPDPLIEADLAAGREVVKVVRPSAWTVSVRLPWAS